MEIFILMCDLVPKDEDMIKLGFRKNILLVAISVAIFSAGSANANDSLEFDDSILKSMGFDNVDLSAFSGNGDQFLGEYSGSVKLNSNTMLTEQPIHFYQNNGESVACITPEIARSVFIRDNYISDLGKSSIHSIDAGNCLDVMSLDRDVNIYFDASTQTLNMTIPQAYLEDRDTLWVAPSMRDDGIPGVVLDYSLIWDYDRTKFRNRNERRSESTLRSYGTVGGNIGWFRLRADYQYFSKARDRYNERSLNWSQIYGYTDIGALNAKLYAGEIMIRSNVFDTARIKGVSLFSDENMMPSYLRGYAPQITGVASSNAIVTISQNGGVIRTEQVPSGPFVISDLPSYLAGTVSVQIEEANGETRSYQVDIAQVPFMTRKGSIRYSANIGKIDPMFKSDYKVGTNLVSGDISYGVSSNISLYGGVQHTTNSEYKAANLGVGVNLGELGAVSVDITKSKSKIGNMKEDRSGTSYRFNYAKRFTSSTTLNIAGYRFSSRGFTGLNNYIAMKQAGDAENVYFEKNRFSLSVSHVFQDVGLSVTGTLSKSSYWNQSSMSNYAVSFNKYIRGEGFFKNSSVNITLSRDSGGYNDGNKRIGLYLNIPIDQENNGRFQYGGRYNTKGKRVDQDVRYYASGLGGDYSVGLTANHKRDLSGSIDYSLEATYDKDTGYGNFNGSVNYTDDSQNIRAGFDGSLTLTQYGIATHSRVYDTKGARLILDAGAPGVPMANGRDVSNVFGLVGVSNVSSYNYGTYQIDNDQVPENVEIPDGIVDVAVSDGAIAYRSLGGISGEKAISTITLSDGTYPPFGATVYRENGEDREVAIVSSDGLTYLTGLKRNVKFVVKWNGSQSCELKIESLDPKELQNLTCY